MRLGAVHMQHMMVYGQGNIKRLLSPDAGRQHLAFTWGLEQKSASVCIPHSVLLQQQGHLEDRRPGQCLLRASLVHVPSHYSSLVGHPQ